MMSSFCVQVRKCLPIKGRIIDETTLVVGEKVVPLPQEDSLNAVPVISSAIMFGRGQDQPGVVIELMSEHAIDPSDENAVIEVRNKLWYIQIFWDSYSL